MISLDNVSKTFNRTWDSVSQGWNHLVRRTSNALTQYHRKEGDPSNDTETTQWGLLSADVYDNNDKVIVNIESPGMQENDFDISIIDNTLYIKGEKHFFKEESKGDYIVTERAYGHFERVLPLGYEVDPDHATASYRQGVLHIEVNKSAQHKRRHIQIH